MYKLHKNPMTFIQIVENALNYLYCSDKMSEWEKVHLFYEARYLNPNSPQKERLKYGYDHQQQTH